MHAGGHGNRPQARLPAEGNNRTIAARTTGVSVGAAKGAE
jgi:hypothetical protein